MSKKAVEASPNTVMAENVRNSFPQPKYTDPTPTSSASFKPPRSKDSILKLKNQPTQSEGWFSGFSYIKGYFTGSSTTDNSAKKISDDLKKAQTDKKSSITKNVANQKENQIEQSKKASNKQDELFASRGSLLPSTVLTDSKPASLDKSIADSDKATKSYLGVSSNKVKDNLEKTEQEQQHNAASPSYTPVRHVDNRSTYLHTPDKKGTTSYRVTTGATVNPKPVPCHTSPSPAPIKIVSQQSQKLMSPSRSKAPGRKMSPSPRKPNPESISISSSSRLRSKSTTDRSTIKARPGHITVKENDNDRPIQMPIRPPSPHYSGKNPRRSSPSLKSYLETGGTRRTPNQTERVSSNRGSSWPNYNVSYPPPTMEKVLVAPHSSVPEIAPIQMPGQKDRGAVLSKSLDDDDEIVSANEPVLCTLKSPKSGTPENIKTPPEPVSSVSSPPRQRKVLSPTVLPHEEETIEESSFSLALARITSLVHDKLSPIIDKYALPPDNEEASSISKSSEKEEPKDTCPLQYRNKQGDPMIRGTSKYKVTHTSGAGSRRELPVDDEAYDDQNDIQDENTYDGNDQDDDVDDL